MAAAGSWMAGMLALLAGCNAVFGIDDLDGSGASATGSGSAAVSSTAATYVAHSASAASTGGAGPGGAGGAGTAGAGGGPTVAKRVFVTSKSFTGDFNGYAGAQAECQQLGMTLGPSLWVAWLSDGNHNAIEELADTGPWVLVDGVTVVAVDHAQLGAAMLSHAIDQDENGRIVHDAVWTGTEANGTVLAGDNYHCFDWQTGAFAYGGLKGHSAEVDADWTEKEQVSCASQARLYCFEQ